MEILDTVILGNSLASWCIAAIVALLTAALLLIVKNGVSRRLHELAEKTETALDDILSELVIKTSPIFLAVVSLYAGSLFITLHAGADRFVSGALVLAVLLQAGIWAGKGVQLWITEYTKKNAALDSSSITTITFMGYVAKLLIWSIVLLLTLENMGVDITALVAGLGIGGIAVALAAQNVLGDLFASLSIVLDKPFVIGDFIIVGDYMGTVEHIGIKTTRVRSLSGEQLVFSNTDLLGSRIRNYKRMAERRVVFSIGVVYGTPAGKLESMPEMIREIVESIDGTRFDRSHFASYGDYALNYETVYYVSTPDYNAYMDIQQKINMAIYRLFEKEGIEFAYPTQTLFVNAAGEGAR